MDYVRYSVKELASMEYNNDEDDTISIYDLIKFYKNIYKKLGHEDSIYKVDIINTYGILLIENGYLNVYLVSKNEVGTINISLDENNAVLYGLDSDDKTLNWALKEREESALKRLFIKINKCPVEIRDELLLYRNDLLKRSGISKDNNLTNRIKLMRKRNYERRKLL